MTKGTAKGKSNIPAITGPQLAMLLIQDGWQAGRLGRHGQLYSKRVAGILLTTTVPTKRAPIPQGTLGAILGPKQTRLGKQGLRDLIDKHGM